MVIEIKEIIKEYDAESITIGVLGSHSALDILDGAKDEGMKTIVICQAGREKPYVKLKRLSDEIIILEKFSDILNQEIQDRLKELNTIFIPHRAFTSYIKYNSIENMFKVPIFGNRWLLKTEERDIERNQYYLLDKASVRRPQIINDAKKIKTPVIVKIQNSNNPRERAFFTATDYSDYQNKIAERVKSGIIKKNKINESVIEELIIGTYFNFNYFYSPLEDSVEFLGIDRRLQANLHDFVSLPAEQQLSMNIQIQNVEVGHTPATIRESMLEKVFEIGERFVKATKKEYSPGIIGPFALQSIVTSDLEIIVYDVSPRVPGSPILTTTSPYSKYQFGKNVGTGQRIAMEIKKAAKEGKIDKVIT